MKKSLPYLRYVVVCGNARIETAAFQYARHALDHATALNRKQAIRSSTPYFVVERKTDRIVVGRTAHGDAILEAHART